MDRALGGAMGLRLDVTDVTVDPPSETQDVPVDCVMGPWGEWTPCSDICGGGTQTRTRTVETQPEHGGDACPSSLMEEQACNDHPCPVTGCTDSAATNFDSQATNDDGSCEYNYGCTDSAATNFDS